MRFSRTKSVQSEIDEIEKILENLPEGSEIERFAFEKRLARARQTLDSLPQVDQLPETFRLTFRGAPVDSSRGIFADFAGKASNAFADAFAAMLAGRNERLKYMGPIPEKSKYPLLITGTAVGSFGFEIELPKDVDMIADRVRADEVVEALKDLLRVTAEGNDEQVADLVSEIHPRAVRKVADFLEVLHQNSAWCGLEFRNDFFKYKNLEQLEQSEARLKEGNVTRGQEAFTGEFQGVLPQARTFEFRVSGEDTILKGRVDSGIEDPDILNRTWLHRTVRATFLAVQVGQSRPKYSLLSLEDIADART